MAELPVFTVADLEAETPFDVAALTTDDAVDLGLVAVEVVRERALDLAVRVVLRGDAVFVAKLGTTGPDNDPWLVGKAATVDRFGEPSLLARRRREADGLAGKIDPFDPVLRYAGGSIPLRVAGELVGTLTLSGQPDVVDHAVAIEAARRFLSR